MRAMRLLAAMAGAGLLSGCVAVAAVRVAGDVAEGAVRTAGDVAEAGVDAVTPDQDKDEGDDDERR